MSDFQKCKGCSCSREIETCTRIRNCECDENSVCPICISAGDPRTKSKADKAFEAAVKRMMQQNQDE